MALPEPRGRIMSTIAEIKIGQATLMGSKPRILVFVRTGSRNWRDRWHKAVKRYKLTILNEGEPVQKIGDEQEYPWISVYDVCAAIGSLRSLIELPVVEKWQYALSSAVPRPEARHWCAGGSAGGKKLARPIHPLTERIILSQIAQAKEQDASDKNCASECSSVPLAEYPATVPLSIPEEPEPSLSTTEYPFTEEEVSGEPVPVDPKYKAVYPRPVEMEEGFVSQ
jgi:hypothetical protein